MVQKSFKEQKGRLFIDLDSEMEISVKIVAYFKPTKSMSHKLQQTLIENNYGYMKKPDADNISKIILDSLNGIAYKDDKQITELEVIKRYGKEDKVEVEINYL